MKFARALVLVPAVAIASGAMAQSQSGLDWMRIKYSSLFNREPFGWSQAQADRQFTKMFERALLAGNDSISAQDEKLAHDISRAKRRANTMRGVLSSDLNGDFKVTRDEVRAALRHKYSRRSSLHREARMQREFDRIMRSDTNRDGSITLEEIRKSADFQNVLRGTSFYSSHNSNVIPMSLDQNGDQRLTREEFLQAARKVFDEIDSDGNKLLSEQEMQKFMRSIRAIRLRQSRERRKFYRARRIARSIMRCRLPDWPKGAKPAFAAAYRGQGLANVVFKNRQQLVSVVRIHIEEGPDNIALLLSAPGNVIWQTTGVKERVAKIYLGSRFRLGTQSSVAVVGIDKTKVHFIQTSACLPFSYTSDAERKHIDRAIQALTGIAPVAVVAVASKKMVAIPSGRTDRKSINPSAIAPPKGSPAAPLWAAVGRSFPAGIIRLKPEEIVSKFPVEKSRVLPGRAGLAQLIDQGALEIAGGSVAPSAIPKLRLPVGELRIVAPIQIPPGLGGSIVRRFVLAKNVAVPKGLASQICVVSEVDGKPVPGSGRCR